MNGSANGFAGALFFSLVAVGIILAVGDIIGWGISAVSAILAAICLRHALVQSAEAAEEDHQRIEIQFQQLRHKVVESAASSSLAMRLVSETSESVQENLQGIRSRLAELENLRNIAETNSAMGAALKNIEDNTSTSESSMKNVSDQLEKNFEVLSKLSEDFSKNMETLCSLGETNKSALQTGIKLMQVFGQILKSPSFAKDIGKLCESNEKLIEKISTLEDLKNILSESKIEIATLAEVVGEISKQNTTVIEVAEQLGNSNVDSANEYKEVSENIISTTKNLTEMFEGVKKEISALTKKIEAYNGLTKATLEQYTNLTEQDVRILEKIAEKVNGD